MVTLRDTRWGSTLRRLGSGLFLAPLLLALACSSTTEPQGPVTLFVVNTTCDPGPCAALSVRGFPEEQPLTPGGLWSIEVGTVAAPFACFTLPPSGEFHVSGGGTTTTYTWTLADPIALGTVAAGASALMATPSTGEFVPASAAGWRVTLPGGTTVTPDVACTPPGGLD